MLSSFCKPRRRPPSARRKRPARLRVEQLEDRVVPSHVPLGQEFQGNIDPLKLPAPPTVAIASDAHGDFVIAWAEVLDGDVYRVKARLFDRDGGGQPEDILVADKVHAPNLSGPFGGVTVDVAMTPGGDFVVVHDVGINVQGLGNVDHVFAHYYNASGASLGDTVIEPDFARNIAGVTQPSAARDDAGNVYVAFLAEPLQGKPTTSKGLTSDISAIGGSTLVFPLGIGFGSDVKVQKLDSVGGAVGGLVDVSTPKTPSQGRPSIAADGAGNYVVAWNANAGGQPEVVFRRFQANGTPEEDGPVEVAAVTSQFPAQAVVSRAHDTGAFVITWTAGGFGDAVVHARQYTNDGTPAGDVFQVNVDPLKAAEESSVAVASTGDFVITWTTGLGTSVFARTFHPDGTPESDPVKVNQVNGDTGPVDVAADATLNQFDVAWSAVLADAVDSQALVSARIYRLGDHPPGDHPPPGNPPPPVVNNPPPSLTVDPTPFLLPGSDTEPTVVASRSQAVRTLITFFQQAPEPELPKTTLLPRTFVETPYFILSGAARDVRLGEISGRVFQDLNGNGIQDEDEAGLAGQRVYLDLNGNGLWDPGEPIMETDLSGRYLFSGLNLTRYEVRQLIRPTRLIQTTPEKNAAHVVELSWENSSVPGRNFGARVVQPASTTEGPGGSSEESQRGPAPESPRP